MTDFLNDSPTKLYDMFLNDCRLDINEYKRIRKSNFFDDLTNKWYNDLKNNENIYDVYNHDYYVIDTFNCFVMYSRNYIRRLIKSSVFSDIKNSKIIVDLGCGIGYSTSLLSQLFPNAKIYATNLKNTKQWTFCEYMSKKFNFELIETVSEIDKNVDMLFASEYFEHIISPIEHVDNIIDKIKPKYMIIANSFNTLSIGHFIDYKVDNTYINQKKMSRVFNKHLISRNYNKINCNIWNNKPTIWKMND